MIEIYKEATVIDSISGPQTIWWSRKNDGIYITNLERIWEKLLPLLPLKIQSRLYIFREYQSVSCAEVCCCQSNCWLLLLEPLITRSRQITRFSQRPMLLVLTDHQPLTELCVTQSLLHALWALLFWQHRKAPLMGLRWWMLAWEVLCLCVVPSPVHTHGRLCLISPSTEILKRVKRKSRQLLRRL
ncbi:hypothetical protein J0S82_001177 [Galemys pyrenaicus]|uniref:Uncharacterized protein n=1 Tax=Galemys pyrenaicus TaxID=202257 RepID=A0A8J6DGE6_GALPY|nr:hypothetical protein J0S82_001177 [Galemys pyrenaicus]